MDNPNCKINKTLIALIECYFLYSKTEEELYINNLINIKNQDGKLLVSSREISENFEKRHDSVLRDIDNKIKSLQTSTQNCGDLFIKSKYTDSYGRSQKEYLLTRDGFSFIVMGFTGTKADQWKLKYIKAFNAMEKELINMSKINILPTALNEISELINNTLVKKIAEIEGAIDTKVNARLEELKEYYKPTHAAKIELCNYIKKRLGVEGQSKEYELVKQRVLLMLNANKWQDVPFDTLLGSMGIIDNSIEVIKATRVTKQVSLFD